MGFYHKITLVPVKDCAHSDCSESFNVDDSHRFGVGISHYRKDRNGVWIRSYIQVFQTFHCCSRDHALQVAHANVDNLKNLPFGTYNATLHNPANEQTHETCQKNVEYNADGLMPESALPKVDAITGEVLTNDVYIPHVDDSTRGTHYQAVLGVTLGAGTLDNAIELAHRILDEVLEADYQGKPLPSLEMLPQPTEATGEEVQNG